MSRQIHDPGIEFKFRTPVQMRFSDFDMFGHANNTSYFQYCDLGKFQYFTHFLDHPFDPRENGLVIAGITAEFAHPLLPSDRAEVLTAVASIGTSSLTLEQRVVSDGGRKIHAAITTVLVQFDAATGQTAPISDDWRRRLGEFEGRKL